MYRKVTYTPCSLHEKKKIATNISPFHTRRKKNTKKKLTDRNTTTIFACVWELSLCGGKKEKNWKPDGRKFSTYTEFSSEKVQNPRGALEWSFEHYAKFPLKKERKKKRRNVVFKKKNCCCMSRQHTHHQVYVYAFFMSSLLTMGRLKKPTRNELYFQVANSFHSRLPVRKVSYKKSLC